MDKMRKAGQSGFSFAESLITVTILAFIAIGVIAVAAKKNTFSQNVKAKHGKYECFRNNAGNVRERYTNFGATPSTTGELPKNSPPAPYDCVFVQPAYVKMVYINISGGGGGGSDNMTPPSGYKRLGGSAGETKNLCLSAVAEPDATKPYAYKIKIGNGGDAGKNGEESILRRAGDPDTVPPILSVAGGISGKDVTNSPDSETGEKSGLYFDEDDPAKSENYGSGGNANQKGKGGYVSITW